MGNYVFVHGKSAEKARQTRRECDSVRDGDGGLMVTARGR